MVADWKRASDETAIAVQVQQADALFFPDSPALASLSSVTAEQRRVVQIYECVGFLEYFIWLEQSLVPPSCAFLQSRGLPDYLVDVLQSIRIQEQRHSTWAYELELGILAATGLDVASRIPSALVVIQDAVGALPDDRQDLGLAYSLVVAEVLDFGTALRISGDATLNSALRDFADRHEIEERLHRVYFRNVLVELWQILSSDERDQLMAITPQIASALVSPDIDGMLAATTAAGITDFDVEQMLDDPVVQARIRESVKLVEKVCARAL